MALHDLSLPSSGGPCESQFWVCFHPTQPPGAGRGGSFLPLLNGMGPTRKKIWRYWVSVRPQQSSAADNANAGIRARRMGDGHACCAHANGRLVGGCVLGIIFKLGNIVVLCGVMCGAEEIPYSAPQNCSKIALHCSTKYPSTRTASRWCFYVPAVHSTSMKAELFLRRMMCVA